MKLTLEQAAEQLGKSRRQVRYLIQSGQLTANKDGHRWYVDSEDMPRSPGQRQADRRKREQLAEVVDESLALPTERGRQRYSVRDLRAFQVCLSIYHDTGAAFGAEHDARQALRQVLEHLARGCHRYGNHNKAAEYSKARDVASDAACALAIEDTQIASGLLDRVEQDLMAALAGLLRRMERRSTAPRKQQTKPPDSTTHRDHEVNSDEHPPSAS